MSAIPDFSTVDFASGVNRAATTDDWVRAAETANGSPDGLVGRPRNEFP